MKMKSKIDLSSEQATMLAVYMRLNKNGKGAMWCDMIVTNQQAAASTAA